MCRVLHVSKYLGHAAGGTRSPIASGRRDLCYLLDEGIGGVLLLLGATTAVRILAQVSSTKELCVRTVDCWMLSI